MKQLPIRTLKNNPSLAGMARLLPDVTYSTQTGAPLKLWMMLPWVPEGTDTATLKRPAIVFVQGSAWTFPDVCFEIPQLSQFARMGFVVATVTHRNSLEGHAFPAYLQDVKCAIRYLRAHAKDYGIDPARVAIWGTSSGGNTALLVGLTANDPAYETEEYAGISDEVSAVCACFGPTDLPAMLNKLDYVQNDEFSAIFRGLLGDDPVLAKERMIEMSPVSHVEAGKSYPPFLVLHGTADPLVPYAQCEAIAEKLFDCGADVQMLAVEGAEHEGSFWSEALLSEIASFLCEKLKHSGKENAF